MEESNNFERQKIPLQRQSWTSEYYMGPQLIMFVNFKLGVNSILIVSYHMAHNCISRNVELG